MFLTQEEVGSLGSLGPEGAASRASPLRILEALDSTLGPESEAGLGIRTTQGAEVAILFKNDFCPVLSVLC